MSVRGMLASVKGNLIFRKAATHIWLTCICIQFSHDAKSGGTDGDVGMAPLN